MSIRRNEGTKIEDDCYMKETLLRTLIRAYDTSVIALACFIAFILSTAGSTILPDAYMNLSWLMIILVIIFVVALDFFKLYDLHNAVYPFRFLPGISKSTALTFVLFNFISFFIAKYPASRRFLVIFFIVSPILLLLRNKFVTVTGKLFRFNPKIDRKVLVIGSPQRAAQFARILQRTPFPGMSVVGVIIHKDRAEFDEEHSGAKKKSEKLNWSLANLEQILVKTKVDEVLFCTPNDWIRELNDSMILCSNKGVPFQVYANFFNLILSEANMEEFLGIPIFSFQKQAVAPLRIALKRVIDITFSILMMFLLSPIYLIVAAAIKLGSEGPIFFSQKRSGLNGKIFNFYKFRSMVTNAEDLKSDLSSKNEADGPVFKMKDDPRITGIGKLIRKYSLDELPQFWNVLSGDMSLIGPRPPIPSEVEKYEPWQLRRLSMKPGLSCIWQVSGRSNISFDDWMKMDLYYIDNWSLWLDIKILLKTIPVVISGDGAY